MAPFPAEEARFRDRACPRDHERLTAVKVEVLGPDVKVDACPSCEGVFLDKNELLRITGDARLNAYLRDEVALDSDSTLVCPHCGGIMDAEEAAGVTVEVCLTCYGLWLDKGEMEALKARKNTAVVVRPAGKDEELERAGKAREGARAAQARRQDVRFDKDGKPVLAGRTAGGAVRRRFLWLDDTLDEIVRRWL